MNTYSADFNAPFGGYKESGIGREHGPTAIEEYLSYKTISVAATADPDRGLSAGRRHRVAMSRS